MSSTASVVCSHLSNNEKLSYLNQFCQNPVRLQALNKTNDIHQMSFLSAVFLSYGELAMYFGNDNGVMAAKMTLSALMHQPIENITIIPSEEKLSSIEEASKQLDWIYSQTVLMESEEIRIQARITEQLIKREPTNFPALIALLDILHQQILFNERHDPIDMTNPPTCYYLDLTHWGKWTLTALHQLVRLQHVDVNHGEIIQRIVNALIQYCFEYITLAQDPHPSVAQYLHELTISSLNLCYLQAINTELGLKLIKLIILIDYCNEPALERLKICKNLINRILIDSDKRSTQLTELHQLRRDVDFKLINCSLMDIINTNLNNSKNQTMDNILCGLKNLSYYMLHYPSYTTDISIVQKSIDILLVQFEHLSSADKKKAKKEIKAIIHAFHYSDATALNKDQEQFKDRLQTLINPPRILSQKPRAPKPTRAVMQPKTFNFTLTPTQTTTKKEIEQTSSNKHANFLLALLEQNPQQATTKKKKKKKDRRVLKGRKVEPIVTTSIEASEPAINTPSDPMLIMQPCLTTPKIDIIEEQSTLPESKSNPSFQSLPLNPASQLFEPLNLMPSNANYSINQYEKQNDVPKIDIVEEQATMPKSKPGPSFRSLSLNPASQPFEPLSLIPSNKHHSITLYEAPKDEPMSFSQELVMKSVRLNELHNYYTIELNKELISEIVSLSQKLNYQDLCYHRMYSKIEAFNNTDSMPKTKSRPEDILLINDLIKLEELRFQLYMKSVTVTHVNAPNSPLDLEYNAFSQWVTKHTNLEMPAYTETGALPITSKQLVDIEQAYYRKSCLSQYACITLKKIESNPDLLITQPDLILFVLYLQVHKGIVINEYLEQYIHDFAEQHIRHARSYKTKEFLLMERVWDGLKEGNAYAFFIRLLETKCFKALFPVLSENMTNSKTAHDHAVKKMHSLTRTPEEKRIKSATLNFLQCVTKPPRSTHGLFHTNNKKTNASTSNPQRLCKGRNPG